MTFLLKTKFLYSSNTVTVTFFVSLRDRELGYLKHGNKKRVIILNSRQNPDTREAGNGFWLIFGLWEFCRDLFVFYVTQVTSFSAHRDVNYSSKLKDLKYISEFKCSTHHSIKL